MVQVFGITKTKSYGLIPSITWREINVKLYPCIAWVHAMKRKRDIQGKFTLKNQNYRQVRSLRLTDSTWKELGIASECLGITRADLLENLVQRNKEMFSQEGTTEQLNFEKLGSKAQKNLNKKELSSLANKVLAELRLGKQAVNYKLVQKSLNRLIELISISK